MQAFGTLGDMAAHPRWLIRHNVLALIIGAIFVLAACGSDADDVQTNAADTPSSDLFARCGSAVFPAIPPDIDAFPAMDVEIQAVFDEFVTGPLAVEAAFIADFDMRVVERTDTTLELLGSGPDGYATASFEKRDGAWSARGWGGCNIEITAPGFGTAQTILDPDVEPDPASSTLHVWIQERECASGQAPTDREVIPVVVESADRVEITTLVAPVAGDAECPSNPWYPVTVELDEPLGERTIVDAHMPPGVELMWPPDVDG